MKLRIRGNSVRVRLSQGETARLGAGETVDQITQFRGDQRLISRVEPSATATEISAEFTGGHIRIVVPAGQARLWAGSDAVSLEAAQQVAGRQSLSILIEKDFECLHSPGEENADAFPNPRR